MFESFAITLLRHGSFTQPASGLYVSPHGFVCTAIKQALDRGAVDQHSAGTPQSPALQPNLDILAGPVVPQSVRKPLPGRGSTCAMSTVQGKRRHFGHVGLSPSDDPFQSKRDSPAGINVALASKAVVGTGAHIVIGVERLYADQHHPVLHVASAQPTQMIFERGRRCASGRGRARWAMRNIGQRIVVDLSRTRHADRNHQIFPRP